MNETPPVRVRIAFEKGPEMRYTGHLDLQRTWERTLRRAKLPLAYTQGFNRRARMQLGPALPLGCTSICELLDVWLSAEVEPEEVLGRLQEAAPPGLVMRDVAPVPPGEAALQNQVVAVEYEATIPGDTRADQGQAAVEAFLAQAHVERIRRGKRYDLRPLVQALEWVPGAVSEGMLRMKLSSLEGATGRPEEVLLALDLEPAQAFVRRTKMFF
jgi:radical SAM-linked protein